MRNKLPVVALFLCLSLVATLPSTYLPSMHALNQASATSWSPWSPFGPQESTLIYYAQSDPSTMFNAFQSGQLDITDWPIPPSNLPISTNPDFYVTSPTSSLGIY